MEEESTCCYVALDRAPGGEGGKGNERLGDQHDEPYSDHKEQDTEE